MTWLITTAALIRRAGVILADAARTALDIARRLVIYACLAAVIIADWILDRIDPDNRNAPR